MTDMTPQNDVHYLEAELRALFGGVPTFFDSVDRDCFDGLWLWDLEQPEHEYMSPRFWEVLGIDPATRSHRSDEWKACIFEDDLEVALANFHKHLSDPSHPYDQIVRYRHVDGSTVWVRCRGTVLRDATGKPARLFGVHTDVSETTQIIDTLSRSEVHFRSQTELFNTMVETMGSGVVVCDAECKTLVFNTLATDILGTRLERTAPDAWPEGFALLDSETREPLEHDLMPMRRALQGKTIAGQDIVVRRPDGAYRHITVNAKPLYGRGKALVGAVANVRDVSDVRESGIFLQAIVETLGSGVIACDTDQRVTVFNAAAREMMGTDLDHTVLEHLPAGVALCDPTTNAPIAVDSMPLVQALRGETTTGQLYLLHAVDGTTRHVSINAGPIYDSLGRIYGAVAALRDVSELASREAFLNTLVENIGEGICACDADRRITVFNGAAADICGVDLCDLHFDALPGPLALLDAQTGEPMPEARVPLLRAIAGEVVRDEICMLRTEHDGDKIITINAGPIHDAMGTQSGAVAAFRDITAERRNHELQMRTQRLEALGHLTGGVAHDFNNILGTILGSLELLARRVPTSPETRMLLDTALQATRHGADLTRQLLTFARHAPTNADVHSIGDLCAGIDRLATRTIEASIVWSLQLAAPDLSVKCDRTDFETAVLNLILNARAAVAGRPAPRITLAQRRFDDACGGTWVEVSITDNGCGMTSDVRARALEPFFTTRSDLGGTGLGLSAVYGFVKQVSGDLSIYSEVDLGTTIRLRLPCEAAEMAPVASNDDQAPEPAHTFEVLVVDDDEALLMILSASLGELGCNVVTARNGRDATAILERDDGIDLMLTDVVMPGGIGGVELARHAKTLRPELPVVLTSGYAGNRLQGLEAADARFLQKPCSLGDLKRLLAELTANEQIA